MSSMTANREFTEPVRDEGGESVAMGRRNRPATGLASRSVDKHTDPEWAAAHRRMMKRLEEGASLGGLKVEREDLYDR